MSSSVQFFFLWTTGAIYCATLAIINRQQHKAKIMYRFHKRKTESNHKVTQVSSRSCSFGATMEAEAGMTTHSQRWVQFSYRPNVQSHVCKVSAWMGGAGLLS